MHIFIDSLIGSLFTYSITYCSTWVFYRFHQKSNPFGPYCCECPPYNTTKPICWSSILSCLRQSLTSEQKVLSHEITVLFLIVFLSILQDLMTSLNLIFRINQEGIVLLASASLYLAVFSHNHKFFSAHCSNPQTSALDITYHIPVPADTELPLLENQHSFKGHLPFNYLFSSCYKNHVLLGLSYR